MAYQRHFDLLQQGMTTWNTWRRNNPYIQPSLSGADLSFADLRGADLSFANLNRANLRGADLTGASLNGANLIGARTEQTFPETLDPHLTQQNQEQDST